MKDSFFRTFFNVSNLGSVLSFFFSLFLFHALELERGKRSYFFDFFVMKLTWADEIMSLLECMVLSFSYHQEFASVFSTVSSCYDHRSLSKAPRLMVFLFFQLIIMVFTGAQIEYNRHGVFTSRKL